MANTMLMDELHRVNLKAPSNMYGLTSCRYRGHELFVVLSNPEEEEEQAASIVAMHFQPGPPRFITAEPNFARLPGDAEIVSVHAVSLEDTHELMVGITYVRYLQGAPEAFLAIYGSSRGPNEARDPIDALRAISGDVRTVALPFIPYGLDHVEIQLDSKTAVAFLISGRDDRGCMHLHGVRRDTDQRALLAAAQAEREALASLGRGESEPSSLSPLSPSSLQGGGRAHPDTCLDAALFLPEFRDIPSIVICRDSVSLPDGRRVVALGCQDGSVQLCTVALRISGTEPGAAGSGGGLGRQHSGSGDSGREARVLRRQTTRFSGLVTSVKLFSHRSGAFSAPDPDLDDLHLLVTCGVESAVLYRSVLTRGLALSALLPESDRHDSVLCATVADINWDGYNEILIGTYGQEVLVYGARPGALENPEMPGTSAAKAESPFQSLWHRSFTHPVYNLRYTDVTEDGMCELVVLTMFGLHVLQHNLRSAAEHCNAILSLMDEVAALEKELKELGGR